MKKVTKNKLVNIIYNRINKTVPKVVIMDVINVICDYIITELEEDRVVSIHNFGMFSPYHYHGHTGTKINTGEIQYVESFKYVKFIPHAVFRLLLGRKRKKFEKKP